MRVSKIYCLIVCLFIADIFFTGGTAIAAYPDKPLEFIAPASPGGGWDLTCRMTAKVLKETGLVTKPITVINKPGGFGVVMMTDMLRNRKDDQNMLVAFSTVLTAQMAIKKNPYTFKDITPIAALFVDYGIIAVRKDSQYGTFKDLLEDLKKNPGVLTFAGSSGPGGIDHMRAAMIAKAIGVPTASLKYVAFQSGGEALGALLGGHITVFVGEAGEIEAHVEAGTIKPLALLSDRKLKGTFEKTPLARDFGIDVVSPNWRGFYGTPGMKKEVLHFWEDTLLKMVKTKQWQEVLERQAWVDLFLTGDALKKFINEELSKMESLAKELGMVP